MNIQINKKDNYIKLNINGIINDQNFRSELKNFDQSLLSKIYLSPSLIYENEDSIISNLIIHIFCYDSYYYAIYITKDKLFFHKRTIYDEKTPNTDELFEEKNIQEDITDYDKKFHIYDMIIEIDAIEKEYILVDARHGLYHHSTFYNANFNSNYVKQHSNRITDRMLYLKNSLLEKAQKLLKEIKNIENIENLIDLKILNIIPHPNFKKQLVLLKK